jgi:futalosine hydrolase
MHILICAATNHEIEPTLQFLKQQPAGKNHLIRILITGIGGIATTYQLLKSIQEKKPDYIIQAGIAGAFAKESEPGKVVLVFEEILGDLGVEEQGKWNDVFDLQLTESAYPFTEKKLINPHCMDWNKYGLPFVRSLSVNEINTNEQRIGLLQEKYHPVVESMEGAAFHYVCLQEKVPFMQMRAVSNFIGERDKKGWKMEEAISNLNAELIRIIQLLP